MEYIHLNYAATSAKKPRQSIDAMISYLNANNSLSPGRGGEASLSEGRLEIEARLSLCRLFNVKRPEEIIFTQNATTSLNMAINGLVRKGCHVITTSMEHNAVARPLELLRQKGIIELSIIPCNADGTLVPETIKDYIKENTRLMVMTHASNLTGAILDYEKASLIAKEHGLFFILDAAQSAGYCAIDFDNSAIDVLAFTGHKSLMGPTGTGGFIIKKEITDEMEPFITGGTGSISHLLTQPDFLPDKFESGTPNMLGIIGLKASVDFILDTGVDKIRKHEETLTRAFLSGLQDIPVKVYGPEDISIHAPVVSISSDKMDCSMLSSVLFEEYGIITRPGLHCSPLAHKTIGTYPEGTLRFSFGYFTTMEEIKFALKALSEILK